MLKCEVRRAKFEVPGKAEGGNLKLEVVKKVVVAGMGVVWLLALMVFSARAQTKELTLVWEYAPELLSTNLTFVLRQTTNFMPQLALWPVVTNVPGTHLSLKLQVEPGPMFFYMTASNVWGDGESVPSNILELPPKAMPGHLPLKAEVKKQQ